MKKTLVIAFGAGAIVLVLMVAWFMRSADTRPTIPQYALRAAAGETQVALFVSPLSEGERTIQVWASDAQGRPKDVSAVTLQFSMPFVCGDILTIEVPAASAGYFTRSGAFFGMSGSWFADLSFAATSGTNETARLVVPIEQPDVTSPFQPDQPLDANLVAAGRQLYVAHCVSCHGAGGRGDGPQSYGLNPRPTNLIEHMVPGKHTDEQVYLTIKNGRPNTAMPAWEDQFSPEEIWQLTAYLRSLAPR